LDIAGLGQQTTKVLIATVSPPFYLILNIRLLTIYLKIRQNAVLGSQPISLSMALDIVNALMRYTGQC